MVQEATNAHVASKRRKQFNGWTFFEFWFSFPVSDVCVRMQCGVLP